MVVGYICLAIVIGIFVFSGVMLLMSICEAIVGVFAGKKFVRFSLFGIMITRNDGKFAVVGVPFSMLASIDFIDKKPTIVKRIVQDIMSMLLLVISGVAVEYFIYKVFNYNKVEIKIILVEVALFILVIIYFAIKSFLIPLCSKGSDRYLWESDMKMRSDIACGRRYRDCSMIRIEQDQKGILANQCKLYNYYHLLDSKKYELLDSYIQMFREIVGETNNISNVCVPFVYEIIYYYSIINPNIQIAETYASRLEEILVKDMDINGRRVYAGYLIGGNRSKEVIKKVIKQGLYESDRNNYAIAVNMELEMLNELKERFERGIE